MHIAELKCFLDTYMPFKHENEQSDGAKSTVINIISEEDTVNEETENNCDFIPVDFIGSKNGASPEKDLPKNDLTEELLSAFAEIAEYDEFKQLNTYRKQIAFCVDALHYNGSKAK